MKQLKAELRELAAIILLILVGLFVLGGVGGAGLADDGPPHVECAVKFDC